jgi:hypothetical protein
MWRPDRTRLVKLRLHSCGEEGETAWGEDCGPAPAPEGARFVRVGTIPFIHAKPTYGDVIVAAPGGPGALLAWDSRGGSYEEVVESLIEDAGRFTVILEYDVASPAIDPDAAYAALERACHGAGIAVETCFGPWDGEPGRVYLALPGELDVEEVLAFLAGEGVPLTLGVVHPRPRSGRRYRARP